MTHLPRNAFLRSLGPETLRRLRPDLAAVELRRGQVLFQPQDPIDWVYFPETCLLSVLMHVLDGSSVETAMVGAEGGLLLLEACGSGLSGATCLTQIDGQALRAPAAVCRSLMRISDDFRSCALGLFELQTAELRQAGACRSLHSVQPRLARSLLESADRSARRDPLPLTQEFIGAMLGVQRTTVTALAGELQKAGLIAYARGRVQILDVEGLEARACECRRATREQRHRLGLASGAAA